MQANVQTNMTDMILFVQVELTVVNSSYCAKMYDMTYDIPIKDYHICAGPRNDDKPDRGTCVVSKP